jgi:hypothetical protein
LGRHGFATASDTDIGSKWLTKAVVDQQDFSHKKLDKVSFLVHLRTMVSH